MAAFLEEMKTIKLKSRVSADTSVVIKGEKQDDNEGDESLGNITFGLGRGRGLGLGMGGLSPRALRASTSSNSNGSGDGKLSFNVKLRKTDSGSALWGDKLVRTKGPAETSAGAGAKVNSSTIFPLGAKRKRTEGEPQTVLRKFLKPLYD